MKTPYARLVEDMLAALEMEERATRSSKKVSDGLAAFDGDAVLVHGNQVEDWTTYRQHGGTWVKVRGSDDNHPEFSTGRIGAVSTSLSGHTRLSLLADYEGVTYRFDIDPRNIASIEARTPAPAS